MFGLVLSSPSPGPGDLSSLLSGATSIVTNGLSWVGQVVKTVTSNPILLLFVILPLVGLGIGLFRRLINIQ